MPILTRIFAVSILLSLMACTGQNDRTEQIQAALADPSRPEADRARDAQRKPDQIVAFWGIESGMTVLDLFAAGGYYTEVLAAATGPDGKVLAHNNNFLLTVREGVFDQEMTARLADNRLANVERLDRELPELDLAPESLDAVNFVLNYHDLYSFAKEAGGSTEDALRLFYSLLKPDGVLGIIDHSANAGPHQRDLHRINEDVVIEEVTGAGFTLEAESDLLRNPDDDPTRSVFDPELRGNTDRFVLRFRKPATP